MPPVLAPAPIKFETLVSRDGYSLEYNTYTERFNLHKDTKLICSSARKSDLLKVVVDAPWGMHVVDRNLNLMTPKELRDQIVGEENDRLRAEMGTGDIPGPDARQESIEHLL